MAMARTDAKEYIRSQLKNYLTSKGIDVSKNFRCPNPNHIDKKPSARYDEQRNKVHCFTCGTDYDTFDLIGFECGLTGNDLFLKAHALFGLEVVNDSHGSSTHLPPKELKSQPPRESNLRDGVQIAVPESTHVSEPDYSDFFRDAHMRIGETNYPQKRGLSDEVISRFQLGFVEEWKNPKAPDKPASPRLIIPISKHSYIARDTRADLVAWQQDYKILKVGKVKIFNATVLKTATKPIFITEGEIDALSIMTVGGEAVAMGSTAYARILLDLLENENPTQPLIIALDNDDAGREAADILAEGLIKLGITFYRLNPYDGYKDANAALMANRDAFAVAVANAEAGIGNKEEAPMNTTDEKALCPDEGTVMQSADEKSLQSDKETYLKKSALHYLQGFRGGISDDVDTPCTSTGFHNLDEKLGDDLGGGLYEGVYIIGAVTSLGKTTLVTQIADNIAQKGHDVIFFSLEMARNELIAKSVSRHTYLISSDYNISSTAMEITSRSRHSSYSDEKLALIDNAISAYGEYANNIYIIEGDEDIGVKQIRRTIEEHIRFTGKSPIVFIDYLQILASHSERTTDKQSVDRAISELKRISTNLKIPIVAISSFNRQNYKVSVDMEAFKESGAIEYSSDVLLGLQLVGTGEKNFDMNAAKREIPRKMELVTLKNRNGPTGGIVRFDYFARYNCFVEG